MNAPPNPPADPPVDPTVDPHAEYLAACEPEARARLLAIREEWERRIPGAQRVISYTMPALREAGGKGRVIGFFAAFKNHTGIYPPVSGPDALLVDIAPYAGPRGNLAFPHRDPLPLDLIGRVGEALAEALATKA